MEVINQIKLELLKACRNQTPESFYPFLLLDKVDVGCTNKEIYYNEYFAPKLNSIRKLNGKITCKIERTSSQANTNSLQFCWYSKNNRHPILVIMVIEMHDKIYFEVLPF